MKGAILPLAIQTSYAELIDQLRAAELSRWPSGSTFRRRTISGRAYWYVQAPTVPSGRPSERYVGPASDALDAAVEQARHRKRAEDGRRILVRAILAAGLSPPERLAGDILAALASAGVFRLRGVLVGTSAYQIYPALLATRLPASAMRTGDLDVAQDYGVSMALGDALDVEFLDCLRQVSSSFRSISDPFDPTAAASYIDDTQFRVDVLTTNRGGAARGPTHLPSLRTRATRLRFLDFLLREAIVAAVLHRSGVLVNVPRPERYAVHKMIVAAERGAQSPKADKDIVQAESLILALADKRRADDLAEVYVEALDRGAHWRQRLEKSRRRLGPTAAAVLPAG